MRPCSSPWATGRGILFPGLFAVRFSDFFASVGIALAERALGPAHILTGARLMHLTSAVTVESALGRHRPV
ncbi:hypothetical protein ACFYNZ_30115 [Streptomyces kebangsaanensis]|uniref:Uncharacterized protein n=1 Tax=Streptomyces kebangsaanensis TaxID=864058 RepID=A0ABW6L4P0_9ACTN